MHNVPDWGVL